MQIATMKYLRFFDYYLEVFAKGLSGRGNTDPSRNGEFMVIKNIVKQASEPIVFIDGGANIGMHTAAFIRFCKQNDKNQYVVFAVEPVPWTMEQLKHVIVDANVKFIQSALGSANTSTTLYYDIEGAPSGKNAIVPHHYLNSRLTVDQITIDELMVERGIKNVDFLKLDIEGNEYESLIGAQKALENGLIEFIQLEYNQTWIKGGGTIELVLDICQKYAYDLFRINRGKLLSIPSYHYILEDFAFSNLLMARRNVPLPLPCRRQAIPLL